MFRRIMQMVDRPSLLSPPSYTARAVRNDSVVRNALRSIKFWNREYVGSEFAEICGRFHVTASGGGPRFVVRVRRGSRTGGRPRIGSAGGGAYSRLSCATRRCRTWSQLSYMKRWRATHEPKSKDSPGRGLSRPSGGT